MDKQTLKYQKQNPRHSGALPILVLVIAAASVVLGSTGLVIFKKGQAASSEIKNQLQKLVTKDRSFLDENKLIGAEPIYGVYMTAKTTNGSYVFLKIVRGEIKEGKLQGSMLATLPNGELLDVLDDNFLPLVILKDGTKTQAQIIDKMTTFFKLSNASLISLNLSNAHVDKGSLDGLFSGRVLDGGYKVAGNIVNSKIEDGYVVISPSYVSPVTKTLSEILHTDISEKLSQNNVLAAQNPSLDSPYNFEGRLVAKNYDNGTYQISGIEGAGIDLPLIQKLIETVSQANPQIVTQEQAQLILGANSITSNEIKDLTITSADIASDTITNSKILNDTIKNEDIADSAINSAKIEDNTVSASDLASTLTFSSGDLIDLSSITHGSTAKQGLILPNVSSANPSSPSSGKGYLAYDTSGNQLIFYNGSSWSTISAGGGTDTDTLATVTARGSSTTTALSLGDVTIGSNNSLVVGSFSTDPSSPSNGTIWYNSTSNKYKIRENGTTKILCNTTDAGCGAGGGSTAWSSIIDPAANLSLNMGANTSTFTFNAATSTSNLFKLIDTLNNTGTGYILDVETASGSTAKPLVVVARGNAIIDTTATGGVTIGNSTAAQAVTIDAGTAALNLGNGTGAKTINIGTGASGNTINIGTNNTIADTIAIGSALDTITIAGSVTANTFSSSGVTITGGTINSTSVGATTPSTGAFTTLSATGAISGATATNTINNLVINSGALSGLTGVTFSSGNFDQSSSTGTFSTGTGAVSLNGLTTLASGKALIITGGAGSPTATNGTVWYDTTAGKFKIVEGTTVKVLCNTTDLGCGTGGGGGVATVKEGGTSIVTSAVAMNFAAADFITTDETAGQAGIAIDYANSKITRTSDSAITFAAGITFNTTGNTNGVTVNTATGASGNSGAITIQTGATTTSGTSGAVSIDVGAGVTSNGAITIGTTNASGLTIGRSTVTTTVNGTLQSGGGLTLTANQNLTFTSGTGTATQNYSNTTGTANTLNVTNSASSGTNTVIGKTIAITGTINAAGSNTTTGINFANVAAATNNTYNGITFGTGFNNFLTSGTVNITAAGAVSGVTTLGLSGAITGATATNTINNLVINSGALSSVTGITMSSGNFSQSGTGTFGTGTGAVSLNGDTTIAAGKLLVVTGGAGSPTATNGVVWYDTTAGKYKIVEGGVVKVLCNTTDLGCGTGGGGGISTVKEGGTSIVTSAVSANFAAADFIITDETAGQAGIAIDYANSKIIRKFDSAVTFDAGITFNTTGNLNGVTINTATGASGNSGAITIQTGGTSVSGTSGNVSIDTGAGVTSNGTITIGGTNASGLAIGRSTVTTTVAGTLSSSGGISLAANQGLTFVSGTGTLIQNYSNTTGTQATLSHTNSASSGTNTSTVLSLAITGTANAAGSNTITGLNFPNIVAATNNTYNGITFGTGFNNFLTSGTINITAAGAVSGVTTLGLSGAITGATATNTINGIIINSGAVSGVSTLALSGAISGATATNTINGLIINSGALSGVTTINASGQITSTLATGTAPFVVASTTNVVNLNASSLNGATFASPGAIGGTTPGSGAFTTLSATGAITAPTTVNTINGVIINAGAVSGVSTLGLSGAIAGATATNTINGLIINSGALSGATTLGLSGAITGATATNTINGIIINSGAVSNVSTLGLSGAITGATVTNTINGVVINSGAVSSVTTLGASSTVTIGSGGNTYTFNPAAAPALAGTARPDRRATLVPEYSGAVLTGTGTGTMTSDFCAASLGVGGLTATNTTVCNTSGDTHNYYNWTTSQGTAQTYSVYVKWRVPDNFSAWDTTNSIQAYAKRSDATNGHVNIKVFDTANALNNAGGTEVAGAANTWVQNGINISGGTWTVGSYITLQIDITAAATGGISNVGEINLNYFTSN